MASILTIGINKDKIQFNEKGWANVTVVVNDETNQYGQNVSASMNQTKEQREAKEAKTYLGNGKVVWMSDAGVTVAEREEEMSTSTSAASQDDLPF